MKNSTIEIKITNEENGEITNVKFSTDDIKTFLEISDEILDILYAIPYRKG